VTGPAGYCSGLRPVSQETRVQRVPLCTGSARCMIKDGKISTSPWPKRGAEIVEYPDSGKVGAGVADPTSPVGFRRIGMFRADSGTLDYWESEPEAG